LNLFKKQVESLVTFYGGEIRGLISHTSKKWIYLFISSFSPRKENINDLAELIHILKKNSHINFEDIFLKIHNFTELYVLYKKYFYASYFTEQLLLINNFKKLEDRINLLSDNEKFILYICSGLFNININKIAEIPWLLEISDWSLRKVLAKLQDPENIEIRQNLLPNIDQKDSINLYDFLNTSHIRDNIENFTTPQCTHLTDIEIDLNVIDKYRDNGFLDSKSQYVIYSFYLEDLNKHLNIIKPNPKDKIYIGHTNIDLKSLNGFVPEKYLNISNKIYTKNIGLDWGGRLQIFANIPSHEDITFISHVKKSPYHSKIYTKKWVSEIARPITLNQNGQIAKYMHDNPSLGIIASNLHRDSGIGKNYKNYHILCDLLEISNEYREINYLAGSYFVIRTSILIQFYSKLNLQQFANDQFCFDGTLAHSCERAIFSFARSKKFKIAWI
tara:strand:+ start:241 stop:1575 length:1335 start_codon:yes stop_codon:yes gene_type:complete